MFFESHCRSVKPRMQNHGNTAKSKHTKYSPNPNKFYLPLAKYLTKETKLTTLPPLLSLGLEFLPSIKIGPLLKKCNPEIKGTSRWLIVAPSLRKARRDAGLYQLKDPPGSWTTWLQFLNSSNSKSCTRKYTSTVEKGPTAYPSIRPLNSHTQHQPNSSRGSMTSSWSLPPRCMEHQGHNKTASIYIYNNSQIQAN